MIGIETLPLPGSDLGGVVIDVGGDDQAGVKLLHQPEPFLVGSIHIAVRIGKLRDGNIHLA